MRAHSRPGRPRRVRIFASGDLDEDRSPHCSPRRADRRLRRRHRLDTSADAPYLDCAYKLEEYAGRPRRKRSEGKATWPGRKQVYRIHAADGNLDRDILMLENDVQAGTPLIQPFMLWANVWPHPNHWKNRGAVQPPNWRGCRNI